MTGEFLSYNVKVQKVKFVILDKFFMEFDPLVQQNNFKMIFIILILRHAMSVRDMRQNAKDNQHALKTLINSTLNSINIIIKHNKSFAAVYAISDRYDNTIIYVGETSHIGRRIKDHLSGNSSFSEKLKIPETELKWYNVRYRHMSDERQRKLFEAYVIGTLKPKYNFN